jgi:hypothetical protein
MPVEELLPSAGAYAGAGLLLARAWLTRLHPRKKGDAHDKR